MRPKTLAWNVDTQYDFMRPQGELPVPGAQNIEKTLAELTKLFAQTSTQVVNTRDWHTLDDPEIKTEDYDFNSTYPPHCMAGTPWAEYVPATNPDSPLIISRDQHRVSAYEVRDHRNIVLNKNEFDVFSGSPHTHDVLDIIKPDRIVVYGVATNVCVRDAVEGMIEREEDIYVVSDAIKALPNDLAKTPESQVLKHWTDSGVQILQANEVHEYLR